MPAFNIEVLDDPIVYDGIGSFVGGQVSGTRANLLSETESAGLKNCDVTRTGECRTRRGSARLKGDPVLGPGAATFINGLCFYESGANAYLIAAANDGVLYKFTGTAWVALTGYTFNSATQERVQMVMGSPSAKLFLIAPGSDNFVHYWNGTTWTALAAAVNTDPPSNPTFMAWHTRRLVLVKGDEIYFSQFLDGTVFDRAKWSLSPAGVATSPHMGPVGGDGIPITGVASWTDFNLIVMKRQGIFVINCDPALQLASTNNDISGFQVKPIHPTIGCLAPLTAVQVGNDLYVLTTSGVRSMARTLAGTESQTDIGDPLSYPIQDIIDRINPSAIATATATFWNNRYILALPLDGATQPNYVSVYNVLTNSWHGTWAGWLPTCFGIRTVSGVPRLVLGQSNGVVLEWLDYVAESSEVDATYQDDGQPIPVEIITKAFDFKEPVCSKDGFNSQFEFFRSQSDVTVQVIRDGGDPESYRTFPTAGLTVTLPVTLPFTLPKQGITRRGFGLGQFGPFRELQYRLTTTGGKMVLRSILSGAQINTMDIEL